MVEEKVNSIIAKERVGELMPFLKTLTKDEKKDLARHLKTLNKDYLEFRQDGNQWRQKGSPIQINIIYVIAFFCLNRKDYQKFDAFARVLDNDLVNGLLSWYCPDWFSDYINDLTKRDWLPWSFRYRDAIELEEKGYIALADELAARLLPQAIFERGSDHKYTYAPQHLHKKKITLDKHIWLLFQYETPIHTSDRYLQFDNAHKDERLWIKTIKELAAKGFLDRTRLLKESMLGTARNFNKGLSAWFVDLFEAMEPAPGELLAMQAELLNALTSQHSRAVNGALQSIKAIVDHKDFNTRAFLDHAPVLLSSETKSIVITTLSLFEKVIRCNKSFTQEVCVAACQAFIRQDEQIQTRVSKLLVKHQNGASEALREELARYADSMLMSSKKMLMDFSGAVAAPPEALPEENHFPSTETWKTVEIPTSLDELIFLSSQAFDNNDPLHIDLLPAALLTMQDQLTGAVLPKLQASLQRAYNTVIGEWRSTMGYLDHLLGTFFIDLTHVLIERFPTEGAALREVHEFYRKKDRENKLRWAGYTSSIPELYTWSVQSRDNTYIIHKTILYLTYQRIKSGIHLPLLSTPTHELGYLDPVILVKRLAYYQRRGESPDLYDFQLAISRVAPFNHPAALDEALHSLKGEQLNLMRFLLDAGAHPTPPFTLDAAWFMAAVTKSPYDVYRELSGFYYAGLNRTIFTGNVPWKSYIEDYKILKYNYLKRRNDEVPAKREVLRLTIATPPKIWQEADKPKNIVSKLARFITGSKKDTRTQPYVLYEFLSLKAQWISAEQNDIQRFMALFPSNPTPLLALIAARSLESSTLSSETDKRMLTKTLESMVRLKFHWCEFTHVFLASCMLTNDKTVRSFAAELWINAVPEGTASSDLIGKIIGLHFTAQYAPMKRFTELVSDNLLKISARHNLALEHLLTAAIEYLPTEPPVGTKRLLELYSEIRLMNGSAAPSAAARQKLSKWTSVSSLKKVISSIEGIS